MIHEIAKELGARLAAIGLDAPVVEGPENPTTTWGRERVVLEHTFDGDPDSFAGPRTQSENPKRRYTRTAAYKLTVYATSKKPGASLFEHCRRAEKMLDAVLVEMEEVAATRLSHWAPKSGRFVTPELLKGAENPGGAVYELAFTFDRAVAKRKWSGEIRPTATLARVSMSGSPALTFAQADSTITRAPGSWLTDGFAVGMRVGVRGSASNNVSGATITAATATVLTTDATLADEASVSGCKVVAGGIRNSAFVSLAGGPDDDGDDTTVPASAENVWTQE